MDIILNDGKGNFYQLTNNKQTTPFKDANAPILNTPSAARTFLSKSALSAPDSWKLAWKEISPNKKTALDENKILEELANMLSNKELRILVRKNNQLSPSKSKQIDVNGNQGSSGSAESTVSKAENRDKPIVNNQPDGAKKTPNDKSATKNTATSKTNKDSTTGAAPDSETCKNGCPISMVSGEEMLSLSDFTLPGPMPFEWKRFYRTSHSRDTGIGHGWTHSANEYLVIENQKVIISDDEGRYLTFKLPALYQRSKLINEGLDLDFVGYDCFVLKQQGQGDKVFTRLGDGNNFRLTQLRHPAFRESQQDHLAQQDPTQGFCIDLHYDANNRLSRLQGNWGKGLKLNYNEDGRITKVIFVNEKIKQQHIVAEYDYDNHGDLIAHRNSASQGESYHYSNHIIIQRTLVTGFSYYFEWDKPVEESDNQVRCIRNWGDHGIYDYHFKWEPENNTSYSTDSRGYTTSYIYNEFGLITKEIDPEGGEHNYSYSDGRKTQYTDPEGNVTTYFFTTENQAAGSRDALGNSQIINYFNGNATEFKDKDGAHWRRSYTRQGLIKTLTDPYGRDTNFSYYDNGLLKQTLDPDGRSTDYGWNAKGELTLVTDFNGHQQQLKYNERGQVSERHVLLKGQDEPSTTQYNYTSTGQLDGVIAPNGDITSYKYNNNDQLIHHSDPQGRITSFEYDGLSQVVKRTDASGHTLRYQYDKERNLSSLINENGETYKFEYDGCERLIKETGFDGRTQNYQYNKAGYLIKHIDAGAVITEFDRDALGQMLTKTSMDVSKELSQERSRYRYDTAGRLIETYNQHQLLNFTYDRLGNLEKEHHSDIRDNKRISATNADIHYGNLWPNIRNSITLPDGQQIEYLYSHDRQQQLEKIKFNGNTITKIQRDVIGREVGRDQGAVTTQTEYDPMGRLLKQQAFNKNNKHDLIHREYGYDDFGNLNQFKDGQHETRYVYDLLNRIEKTEGEFEENFNFDPAGNILGVNESSKQSPQGNRLDMQGDRKFNYDERGNLIKETRGKGGKLNTVFNYNLQNQLVKVVKEKQTIEYKYDPLGRRIEKQDTFGITQYLWADDQLTQEIRNNIKKTYVYEPKSFKPVALIQDDEVYHYHLDHLGTPRELTNNEGDVVWKVRYKTYGNVAVQEFDEIENNLRFQGQYFDEETGLHYNRHRYYNPNTGQFISQDPIGLLGGVNNYQYAPNPTGWIDPFGLSCKEGKAIIRQYENGHPEGHFTIEIIIGDTRYNTHQVITSRNDHSKTTIVRAGKFSKGNVPVHEAIIDLPDAQAAMNKQKNMINEELGVYDPIENSCLSHVCDIVEVGGTPSVTRTDKGYMRFTRKNGFRLLR